MNSSSLDEMSKCIATVDEGRMRMTVRLRMLAALAIVIVVGLAPLGTSPALAQDATPGSASGTPQAATCPPDTPEALVELAETWVAAVNAEDTAPLEGMFHEVHIHSWAIGEDTATGDEYLASLQGVFDAFDDYSFTAEQILVSGNFVTIRWVAAGTQVQDFQGFAPSDQATSWPGISVFHVECGQVTDAWTVADHLNRLQQHGTAPEAGATPEQ